MNNETRFTITMWLLGFLAGMLVGFNIRNIAFAQSITHETTITASVPLWFEVTTSTDTVTLKTNGKVIIQNPENNYEN